MNFEKAVAAHYLAARAGSYRQPPVCGCMTRAGLPCQRAQVPGLGLCPTHFRNAVRDMLNHVYDCVRSMLETMRDALKPLIDTLRDIVPEASQ